MEILVATDILTDGHALRAALALAESGHSVSLACTHAVEGFDRLAGANVEISEDFTFLEGRRFDAVISDHAATAMLARHFFPETPLAFILTEDGRQPSVDIGISAFIRPADYPGGAVERGGEGAPAAVEIDFSNAKVSAVNLENLLSGMPATAAVTSSAAIPHREILFYRAISREHAALADQVARLAQEHGQLKTELAGLVPKVEALRCRFNGEMEAIRAERLRKGLGFGPELTEDSQPRSVKLPVRDRYRGENLVFILGPPRSGTTWVLSLMKEHPDVVAATVDNLDVRISDAMTLETGIFVEDRGLADDLIRDRFYELSAANPGKVIVGKTPIHTLYADRIRAVFPLAALILVQRDGRDVVASMIKVSKDRNAWWRGAPGDVADAAALWLQLAEAALAVERDHHPVKLLYEDLLEQPEAQIRRVLTALGMATASAGSQVESSRAGRNIPIKGVYRRGRSGGWRNLFGESDVAIFKAVAGKMLIRLGYEPDDGWSAVS